MAAASFHVQESIAATVANEEYDSFEDKGENESFMFCGKEKEFKDEH